MFDAYINAILKISEKGMSGNDMRILKILGIILLVVVILIAGLLLKVRWESTKPFLSDDYYEKMPTDAPLENKYIRRGSFSVSAVEFPSDDRKIGGYKVWYPDQMTEADHIWPLIVVANASGCSAHRYEPYFDRLASWGFVVVGNQDEHTGTGYSPSTSLDLILAQNTDPDSLFCGKIDLDNIGIAGYSQGGAGAINAVVSYENGCYYKTLFTGSAAHRALSEAMSWTYDPINVTIPWFMTAGTQASDAGEGDNPGIAPLFSLLENAAALPTGVPSVIARAVDADHGDMLERSDGYLTAWMLYWLQNNQEAGLVFFGDDPELLKNPLWQDVKITVAG